MAWSTGLRSGAEMVLPLLSVFGLEALSRYSIGICWDTLAGTSLLQSELAIELICE